jgi:glycosyltransferase involved in cell wall biosynthesis
MEVAAVSAPQGSPVAPGRRFGHRRSPRVSVVIPTLNEERNLPGVLGRLPDGLHELILVDARSTDSTVATARWLYPDVRVIEQRGRGKGAALALGFAAATGDIVVTVDGDGSTDPAEIPRFVEALMGGADIAKGSRFLPNGGSDDLTAMRRVGARALTGLANLVFGTRYTDLCYGYTAIWRETIDRISVADGFEVETSMSVSAARAGLAVAEVPSYEHARLHGASNLRAVRDGLRVVGAILGERARRRPRTAPDPVRATG